MCVYSLHNFNVSYSINGKLSLCVFKARNTYAGKPSYFKLNLFACSSLLILLLLPVPTFYAKL